MKVLSVNMHAKHGPKEEVKVIELKENHGVIGDVHAGSSIRQVSLLAKESHDEFQPMTEVCLKNGIFGENITTQRINLKDLKLGQIIKINDCVLEISELGKVCHAPCQIAAKVGDCIMPRECVFGIVKKGGKIRARDEIIVQPLVND